MTNYLFLHAHPDDEAIFTGGIIRKLINDGHNVHVVFATGGELGAKPDICTKIISPGAAPVVTCTGSVPENLIQKIRESDQTHLEVPSDGNGNYTFTATQIN